MNAFKGKAKLLMNGKVVGEFEGVEIRPDTSKLECPLLTIPESPSSFNISLTMDIKNPKTVKEWNDMLVRMFNETKEKIFFWTQKDKYGAFSNFSRWPFQYQNIKFETVEHFYQARKSIENHNKWLEIIQAKTPAIAKKLGQKVALPADWEEVKYEVMLLAVRLKFYQNVELIKLLMDTGDALIYEDSPYDKIWGTGEKGGIGTGQNLLGKVLMQVRAELQLHYENRVTK